jgi:hypothetical protein
VVEILRFAFVKDLEKEGQGGHAFEASEGASEALAEKIVTFPHQFSNQGYVFNGGLSAQFLRRPNGAIDIVSISHIAEYAVQIRDCHVGCSMERG